MVAAATGAARLAAGREIRPAAPAGRIAAVLSNAADVPVLAAP